MFFITDVPARMQKTQSAEKDWKIEGEKKKSFIEKNPVDQCKANTVFLSGSMRSDAKSTRFDELVWEWSRYRCDATLEIRWNIHK